MFITAPGRWAARAVSALAATAMLLAAAGAAPAASAEPACGDTITQDTRLTADLVDCPGSGLVIGADGVTLDLGGHVVDGGGSGAGIVSHGVADVRIENGTIREFGMGISLGRGASFPGGSGRGPASVRHVLRRLEIVGNGTGVSLFRVTDNTLERSTLTGNRLAGVDLNDTGGGNRIDRNAIAGNGTGVLVTVGRGEVVSDNRIEDNERNGIVVGWPFTAPFSTNDNRIVGNVVRGNGMDGILIQLGRGNVVEGNRVRGNADDGIDAGCPDAMCTPGAVLVTANDARRNGDLGIEADAGVGDGGRNRAKHNGDPAECTGVRCR